MKMDIIEAAKLVVEDAATRNIQGPDRFVSAAALKQLDEMITQDTILRVRLLSFLHKQVEAATRERNHWRYQPMPDGTIGNDDEYFHKMGELHAYGEMLAFLLKEKS